MVTRRYYDEDGLPKYVIQYKVAADGTLVMRRLIYAGANDFDRLWDKGTDADVNGS